jgi:Protein of unknown function (DUF1631)
MDVQGSGPSFRAAPKDSPPSLKDRPFAPRPRAVLEGVFAHLAGELERSLRHTLNEYEQALFRMAEQSRSNEEQQRCFESLREIRRTRADIAPRFLMHLEGALAESAGSREAPAFSRARSTQRDALSLVNNTEFEESLALLEAASRAEIKLSQKLFALGQRFGVLVAAPAFEPEELPIGPQRLCECLRLSMDGFELPAEHRHLLFKVFDRHVMHEIEAVYDGVNNYLVDSRILPNLIMSAPRLRRDGAANANTPGAAQKAAQEEARPTPESAAANEAAAGTRGPTHATPAPGFGPAAPSRPPGSAWSNKPAAANEVPAPLPFPSPGARAGAPENTPTLPPGQSFGISSAGQGAAADDEFLVGGFGRPLTGWPGMPQQIAPEPPSNDVQDRQMFSTLRELLAGRRTAMGMTPATPAGDAHVVGSADIQSVLGYLQSQPATTLAAGGKMVPRTTTHIKQDMLNQLRQVTPQGKLPRLPEEDADTIDLVGMLFDNLAKEGRTQAPVQQLMSKLQVPVMRVALRDKSFFSRRSHPARQLLNALAEGSFYYMGEEEQDRGLVEKMQVVVDRVTNEFDADTSVFEDLLSDFARHLHTLVRKSEVAEKRNVEAVKGREKLDQARKAASAAIAEKIKGHKPRALIRTLLEQAWADVLALTILRSGEHSEAFQRRLAIVDRLLQSDLGRQVEGDLPKPPDTPQLRSEVESGLSQVGFHLEDVQSVIGKLFDDERAAQNDDPATLTEVAAKLRAKARFGEESGDSRDKALPARAEPIAPLTTEEQRIVDRLKGIPYGTWFEMLSPGGAWQPRKLSWFSPLSGRCLFVNQRGARAEEMSLETLAQEIHSNRARVMEDKRDSLIDRAWGAIVRTLKQISAPEAEAAEAKA